MAQFTQGEIDAILAGASPAGPRWQYAAPESYAAEFGARPPLEPTHPQAGMAALEGPRSAPPLEMMDPYAERPSPSPSGRGRSLLGQAADTFRDVDRFVTSLPGVSEVWGRYGEYAPMATAAAAALPLYGTAMRAAPLGRAALGGAIATYEGATEGALRGDEHPLMRGLSYAPYGAFGTMLGRADDIRAFMDPQGAMYDAGRAAGRAFGAPAQRQWSLDDLGFDADFASPRIPPSSLPTTGPDELGFYSAALRHVETNPQPKQRTEAWDRWLKSRPGVTQEEMNLIGWDDFVEANRGQTLAREDVARHIRDSQPRIDERTFAGDNRSTIETVRSYQLSGERGEAVEFRNQEGRNLVMKVIQKDDGTFVVVDKDANTVAVVPAPPVEPGATSGDRLTASISARIEANRLAEEHAFKELSSHYGPARYAAVGAKLRGSNYREAIIRDPNLTGQAMSREEHAARRNAAQRVLSRLLEQPVPEHEIQRGMLRQQIHDTREKLKEISDYRGEPLYESPHFKDQDVIHYRFDDVELPPDQRVMRVHEIQSDLHQKGRREGYRGDPIADMEKKLEAAKERKRSLQEASALRGRRDTAEEFDAISAEGARIAGLTSGIELLRKGGRDFRVPPGIYRGDWINPAVRRILRRAAEENYDAVVLARPEQIAEAVGQRPESLMQLYGRDIPTALRKAVRPFGLTTERLVPGHPEQVLADSVLIRRRLQLEDEFHQWKGDTFAKLNAEDAAQAQEWILDDHRIWLDFLRDKGREDAISNFGVRLTPEARERILSEGFPRF